ncbi:MAG: 16S rRNA (cytosine(1402)-N(4))-methyltransferase RsmH [Candidatus Paceibacteria bacterium]
MDRHIPVLTDKIIDKLKLESGDNVVDCTVGDGGHSEEMLKEIAPGGQLLAIDADPESLNRAKDYLKDYQQRTTFVRENFSNLEQVVKTENFGDISAVVMDLGWSSSQLEMGKGFSFDKEEPLDMRYSREGKTAADLINDLSQRKLEFIFRRFAEEDFSEEIAKCIIEKREQKKIDTTKQLRDIILEVYREQLGSDKDEPWVGGRDPATKVFQALRIATNKELQALRKALPQVLNILKKQGRMAVISFHSLEDRIVKHFLKDHKDELNTDSDNPITPTDGELNNNPRSRSAKLRVAQKL